MKNLTCTLIAMLAILKLAAKEPVTPNAAKQLLFIENKGQITDQYKQKRKDIDFKLDGGGMSIFGGAAQLHYQWYQYTGKPGDSSMLVNTYRMDVQLIGANPNALLQKEEANSYYENYYSPRLKDGVTAKSYSRMVYKNVYPQIDWVIYTQGQSVKYDFVVHKGGNPADIRLQYNGATSTQLKDGAFTATTPMGSITEEAPYSYEAITKKQVASAFRLKENTLSFDVGKRDVDIVIDPNVAWVTFFGGAGHEIEAGMVVDDSNRVYISGLTNSTTSIATIGAYKSTYTSGYERYIACMNENCTKLWATYTGVFHGSAGSSIAIDTTVKCLYIAGVTFDTAVIATAGAHQVVKSGGRDAYLMRFSLTGFKQWGTYYGGMQQEQCGVLVRCGAAGSVYMCGYTRSADNIATPGSFISTIPTIVNGSVVYDAGAFLVKFNSAGVRQWGTYLCIYYSGNVWTGTANEPMALDADANGNVYVAGRPISCATGTAGAHRQYPIPLVGYETWLGKFSATGSLQWSTFYGGAIRTYVMGLGVAGNGDVYMCGSTSCDTGIATANGLRSVRTHAVEGFLTRFNSQGKRIWGTYIADSSASTSYVWNGVRNVAVISDARVIVAGTSSSSFLSSPHDVVTRGAYQTVRNSSDDTYIGILDTGCNLVWGSFLGGNSGEAPGNYLIDSCLTGNSLAVSDKYVYVSEITWSTSMLAYGSGIYQGSNGGIEDVYIAKLFLDTFVTVKQPFTDTVLCPGDSFKVRTSVNKNFRSGNVFTVQLSDASGSFATPTIIGVKTANGNDSITCGIPYNAIAGNNYRIRIIASAPFDTSDKNGYRIRIKPLPQSVVASSNSPICTNDTLRLYGSSTSTNVSYSWAGVGGYATTVKDTFRANAIVAYSGSYVLTVNRQGCNVKDTIQVLVRPRPTDTATATSNSPVCLNNTLNLFGSSTTSGIGYFWTGPAGYTSAMQSPSRANAVAGYSGMYRLYTELNGCASLHYDSVLVSIYPPTTVPTPSANTPVCVGQDLQLGASTVAGATYSWTSTTGYSTTGQYPVRTSATTSYAGKYYVTATVNGCTSLRDSITVAVNPAPTISMYPSPKDSICVGQNVTFVSSNTNAGTTYTRSWFKNSNIIGGAANANYSSTTAADGDEYYVTLTAYGVCATPYTDTSNVIKMHVLPYLAPAVSITANPNTTVPSGTMINFTATPTNGGNKPAYQWTRNGLPIVGALSSIWGASTLSNNDLICVDMTSNYLCPNPKTAKSNCIKVSIESTGGTNITGIWTGKEPSIYPNPATEKLIIEGIAKGTKIQLYDVIGRVVIKETSTATTTELNMAQLVPGNYVLTLSTETGDKMSVKVVKE